MAVVRTSLQIFVKVLCIFSLFQGRRNGMPPSSLKPWNRRTLYSLIHIPLKFKRQGGHIGLLPKNKGFSLANCPGALEQEELAKLGMACAFKSV